MRVACLVVGLLAVVGSSGAGMEVAQPRQIAGSSCSAPPILHCPDDNCPSEVVTNGGPVAEKQTGRNYFLDYPCDLKDGEPVTFILSLHGGRVVRQLAAALLSVARLRHEAPARRRDPVFSAAGVERRG